MPEVPDENKAECTDFHQQQEAPAPGQSWATPESHTQWGGLEGTTAVWSHLTAQEGALEHLTRGCAQIGLNFSRGDSTTSIV